MSCVVGITGVVYCLMCVWVLCNVCCLLYVVCRVVFAGADAMCHGVIVVVC